MACETFCKKVFTKKMYYSFMNMMVGYKNVRKSVKMLCVWFSTPHRKRTFTVIQIGKYRMNNIHNIYVFICAF